MKSSVFFLFAIVLLCSCTEPTARRPITQKTATVISETIAQSKKLNAAENAFVERYIAQDSTKIYQTSTYGFWYTYQTKVENDSVTPVIGNEVEIEYDITDINGAIIYSKEELGKKIYQIDKEDFISGLQEGIKLMKIGETITFVIPSYRAFGLVGDGDKIGINKTIKSTVTLLTIK